MVLPITISGDIFDIANKVRVALEADEHKNSRKIDLTVTSKGGSYIEGLDLFNTLSNSGKDVHVHIPSYAMSAGALTSLAGNHISMAENAVLMFHEAFAKPNNKLTAEEIVAQDNALAVYNQTLVKSISGRTGMSESDTIQMLKQGRYLTAGEALGLKLIDEVIPVTRRNMDIYNLEVPDTILNHVKEVEKDMSKLLEICEALNLEVSDEEKAATVILNHIAALEKRIPKPKATLPLATCKMIAASREFQINNLVGDGKILPIVVKDYLDMYTNVDNILNHVTENGDIADDFDKAIAALNKNETVISFKGRTNYQQVPNPNADAERNVMVETAKKRLEGANK